MPRQRAFSPTNYPNAISLSVMVVVLALTAWLVNVTHELNVRQEQREMHGILRNVESNVKQTLDYSRLAARTLIHTIGADGVPQDFDSVAAELVNSQYLDAVQMVPDGVISYQYPLEGHEVVLGYDILNDPAVNAEAREAIERRTMFFAGPFELRQGGMGVVGRIPVFIRDEFWGFSAVIIRLERLLANAGINEGSVAGYSFQLIKVNPNTGAEEAFLPNCCDGQLHAMAYEVTSFPEAGWTFYVYPTDRYRTMYGPVLTGVFGLLLALSLGYTVCRVLDRSENRFQSIFEQAADGIFIADMRGNITMVNPALCEMTGYGSDQLLQMRLRQLMDDDHLALHPLRTDEVANGRSVRTDRVVKRSDSTTFDAEVIARRLKDGHVQGVVRDISEKKRARAILEQEVEKRTRDLNEANLKLESQHRDITDSLRYAKRLQETIIRSGSSVKDVFPYSFVLMRPRDEVSGDFFWVHETEENRMVAVVDCTGHGVPGAMLSMLGVQMLNDVVKTQGITAPQQVLQRMDVLMASLLQKENRMTSFDGMDMIYCCLDKASGVFSWAGAQRPLYLFRNGEMTEIAGSKSAIGGHQGRGPKLFEEQSLAVRPSDCFYLTTDGFQSQFGGKEGKKLNKRNFRELLASVAEQPMDEQYGILSQRLDLWMAKENQVDDILVVGIRLDS